MNLGRRRFLQDVAGTSAAFLCGGAPCRASLLSSGFAPMVSEQRASASSLRWPKAIGSPVLDSLRPVIEHSRELHTNVDKIIEVAGWMAYEELPLPEFALPFGIGTGPADDSIDFILVADSIDTAFTDFKTHTKFQVDFQDQHWSDSDAMFACLKRALDAGIPVTNGKFLAKVSREELNKIFAGNIPMPMLDEK